LFFNPNLNSQPTKPPDILRAHFLGIRPPPKAKKEESIPGSANPREHVLFVWDTFVRKSKAKVVAAVAHSAGGDGALNLVRSRGDECQERLCGIAFTDSVHCVYKGDEDHVKKYITKHCRNWVKSDEPLDTVMRHQPKFDCLQVSAGHEKHEFTSGCSIESVFEFLVKKTDKYLAGEHDESEEAEKGKEDKTKKKKGEKSKGKKKENKDKNTEEKQEEKKEEEKKEVEKKEVEKKEEEQEVEKKREEKKEVEKKDEEKVVKKMEEKKEEKQEVEKIEEIEEEKKELEKEVASDNKD